MARPAKFWFRKQTKCFYVTVNGSQVNLGKDEEAAKKEFHRLMAMDVPVVSSSTLAVEIFDKFLLWTQSNRSPETFRWYKKHIQSFIDSLSNQRIDALNLKPHHVTDWVKPTWSKSYQRGAMVAVQRAMRWGVKQGHIDKTPFLNLEKPAAERREDYPTPDDYQLMLKHATEPFKTLLMFVWETGCRPQEAIKIEPKHVNGDKVTFKVVESKGKKYTRVIYLTEAARALVQAQLNHIVDVSKMVFTNRNGRAWTACSINCRMRALSKKTKKHFCMYSLRHGFITRMLEAGLDHMTVARLAGHRDSSMLGRIYSHIGEKNDFLLDQLKRATKGK